jgi:hypothetical protein
MLWLRTSCPDGEHWNPSDEVCRNSSEHQLMDWQP